MAQARGIKFVYSDIRNFRQAGYSFKHYLICSVQENNVIISYGEKVVKEIDKLREGLKDGMSADEMAKIIYEIHRKEPCRRINFVFSELSNANRSSNLVRPLIKADYSAYLEFFKKCNPECEDTVWTEEYFLKIMTKNFGTEFL